VPLEIRSISGILDILSCMVRSPSLSDNSSHTLPKKLSGRTILAAIIDTTITDKPIIKSAEIKAEVIKLFLTVVADLNASSTSN
jgi:hypothetical protein